MEKRYILLLIVILMLGITGCQGNRLPSDVTLSPTNTLTPLPLLPSSTPQSVSTMCLQRSPTASRTPTETETLTPTETNTSTATPTIPPETRLQVQCLEVLSEFPAGAVSNGLVLMGSAQFPRYDTLLLDMTTGGMTKISASHEIQLNHVVSLDRNLIAYSHIASDDDGNKVFERLVIANADGQIQKEIPWEEKWAYILGWTTNQRLLLAYDDPDLRVRENWNTIFAFLILDPFSGEQEILLPVFPEYLSNAKIPYWDGWFGAMYDPTLTRAVYPQMMSDNEEAYTYALWDVSAQKPVASLENIYVDWIRTSISSPKPIWAEDGSRFVFVGHDFRSELSGFELLQVSRDGQIEQLTNLTSIARFRDLLFSWSPDSRKIAMLLDIRPEVDGDDVLILDLETKNIIDTCISVRANYDALEGIPRIWWSPDGKQFLVKDWLDEAHSRIILIDIEQGFAAQIAENVRLNGWMIAPQE